MSQNTHKAAVPMIWLEDKSGETYICPVGAVKDKNNPTEEELKHCLVESFNPQNN